MSKRTRSLLFALGFLPWFISLSNSAEFEVVDKLSVTGYDCFAAEAAPMGQYYQK